MKTKDGMSRRRNMDISSTNTFRRVQDRQVPAATVRAVVSTNVFLPTDYQLPEQDPNINKLLVPLHRCHLFCSTNITADKSFWECVIPFIRWSATLSRFQAVLGDVQVSIVIQNFIGTHVLQFYTQTTPILTSPTEDPCELGSCSMRPTSFPGRVS